MQATISAEEITPEIPAAGTRRFIIMWLGQLVSLIGTNLTSFALGVWVYQRTGSVTRFALISVFAVLPGILFSPLAGALVDRWNRRLSLLLSDLGAAISTVIVALLLHANALEVWHIYIVVGVNALLNSIHGSAYSASITQLIPKQQLTRANGMVQAGQAVAQILAPVMAGVLIAVVGLKGIVLIDFSTFLFAVMTLLLIRIPRPEKTSEGETGSGSLFREASYGLTYIAARRGLLALMIFFAIANLLLGAVSVLVTPLVLSFASAIVLGTVITIGGTGMLAGSLAMTAWGGPKRRINGMLGFMIVLGLSIILAGLRPSATLLSVAAFLFFFALPIINSSSQAILQSKVAPDVQGRVFAVSGMIAWSSLPLAYLLTGPLADKLFEPLLVVNGPLAGGIGTLIGVGPGRGIGLLFIVMGCLTIVITVCGYLYPRLRRVEEELTDGLPEEGRLRK